MKKKITFILIIAGIFLSSCEKFLTVAPEGKIPVENVYRTADDAITAVYGCYSLMQPCVDILFLAGDVQSDLVVKARGADSWIAQIAENRITPQNPYTDYTLFYRLITACNNAISGLNDIQRLDPVNYTLEKYNYNVGEIVCIRSWAYFQLVKIWGDVPYIPNTVMGLNDIKDVPAKPGSEILDIIDVEMRTIAYPQMKFATQPSGMDQKTYFSQFSNITLQCLISEINLYRGDYITAYEYIRNLAPYGFVQQNNKWSLYYPQGDDWSDIFVHGDYDNTMTGAQTILFDGSKGQKNSLMKWTSNINGGIYAVKPSTVAIKNWQKQPITAKSVQYDYNTDPIEIGFGDWRGWLRSFAVSKKDTVIFRYLKRLVAGNYGVFKDPSKNDIESNDDAHFVLYRAQRLFLDVCEMYNNMGMTEMALWPLNGHATNSFSLHGVRDQARAGFRRFDPNNPDTYQQMEEFIIEEMGLELAFEGHRWFDLVRFSKRTPDMLANKVALKYPADKQAEIRAKLMNSQYWHWPYYYKNVEANKMLEQKPGY